MAQSLWLPVLAFVIGIVLVLFFQRPTHAGHGGAKTAEPVVAA